MAAKTRSSLKRSSYTPEIVALHEVKEHLLIRKAKLAQIADAVRDLQEAMLPPDTKEKKRRREKAVRDMADLSNDA